MIESIAIDCLKKRSGLQLPLYNITAIFDKISRFHKHLIFVSEVPT